mgnify:CR=1 FL=1
MLLRLWYTLLSSNCTSTSKALSSNFLSSFKSFEPFEKQRSQQYVTEITYNLLWKTLSIDSYNNYYYATWLCNVSDTMKLYKNHFHKPHTKQDINAKVTVQTTFHTPYSKMAANKLFFCLHVY